MITPEQGQASLARLTAAVAELVVEVDPAAPVPSCPGWTVRDLVVHLGEVHVWAEQCIRLGDPVERPLTGPAAGPAALAAWYADCAETLLTTLRATPPETECWTFGPRPRTAAFWFRRQAHEVAMHRWDLGAALGQDLGYPAALAGDGVDEVVTVFFPRQVRRERIPPLTRSLAVEVAGGPTWVLHGDGTGEGSQSPDAVVSGPAELLVLLVWGRLGLDDPRLTVTGDRAAAATVLTAGIVP